MKKLFPLILLVTILSGCISLPKNRGGKTLGVLYMDFENKTELDINGLGYVRMKLYNENGVLIRDIDIEKGTLYFRNVPPGLYNRIELIYYINETVDVSSQAGGIRWSEGGGEIFHFYEADQYVEFKPDYITIIPAFIFLEVHYEDAIVTRTYWFKHNKKPLLYSDAQDIVQDLVKEGDSFFSWRGVMFENRIIYDHQSGFSDKKEVIRDATDD